ncbi:MAG: DUF456 domain-containing protein [Rhodanobacter sp.]|jgi:uncharacterized protein YqgC (DUF456 family)|nr:DUF456 domain-containing protein [Rhodanobacter sp.]
MDAHILWYALAGILIIAGLAGTIVPILPGVPILFLGMLIAAWANHFAHVGAFTLGILGALSVLALSVDVLAGLLGAQRAGASRAAVIGAALGTLIGLFFGLPGLLLGPFIGALLGELAAGGTLHKAAGVGIGAWLGFLIGTVFKLAVCFAMLGIFTLAYVVG